MACYQQSPYRHIGRLFPAAHEAITRYATCLIGESWFSIEQFGADQTEAPARVPLRRLPPWRITT
jgi:hypothetical protein